MSKRKRRNRFFKYQSTEVRIRYKKDKKDKHKNKLQKHIGDTVEFTGKIKVVKDTGPILIEDIKVENTYVDHVWLFVKPEDRYRCKKMLHKRKKLKGVVYEYVSNYDYKGYIKHGIKDVELI